jgi:hypothetical protein
MSIKKQGKNEANVKQRGDGWEKAIMDAKNRIKRLRYTIRVIQARQKSGDPWPADSATHN